MRQEALQVSKEANSLAEITELPVNMTEHGTEINNARDLSSTVWYCFGQVFFNLYWKQDINVVWNTCFYTEFIQICNFLYCLIMICDCWNSISQKTGSFVT